MKLGEWYNIDYEAQGKETKYWLLPLKVSGPNSLVAAIEIPTGRLTTHFTFAFINKYGKLKKKPEESYSNIFKTQKSLSLHFSPAYNSLSQKTLATLYLTEIKN